MYPVFVRKGAMMKRSQRKQGRSKVTILSILPKRLFNGQWSTKKENMVQFMRYDKIKHSLLTQNR